MDTTAREQQDAIPTQAEEAIDVGRLHASSDTEVDEAKDALYRGRIEGVLAPSVDRLLREDWAREQGVSRAQMYAALERFIDGQTKSLYLDAARYLCEPTHPSARQTIGDVYVERFNASLAHVLKATDEESTA